jgi:DNA ligase-1
MVKSLDHHWQKPVEVVKKENGIKEEEPEAIELLEEEVSEALDSDDGEDEDRQDLKGKGVNGRGKALLSTYEPDKRVDSWLKVKKDYIDGIGDSLDLVPIGAWHGTGRKNDWWSPVLMALYDPDTGTYQAVCKCISGFTDAEYKSMKFER